MPDLAGIAQFRERPDLLFERHVRIDRVQLVEVDAIDLQAPQAALARGFEVFGPSVAHPAAARAHVPAFGRQHETRGIRVQRLGDLDLVDVGTVGVRRVDQRHAEFERPPQHRRRIRAVGRIAHHAGPAQAHRAESQAADHQVSADRHRLVRRHDRDP